MTGTTKPTETPGEEAARWAQITERRLRKLREGYDWYGLFSIENAEAVAARIRTMLDGKSYTFVAQNTAHSAHSLDVRAHLRANGNGMRSSDPFSLSVGPLNDGTPWAHFFVHDTYGTWGITTTHATEREARNHQSEGKTNWTYLHFEGMDNGHAKITIEQFNGYNEKLRWVIAVEYVSRDERSEQEAHVIEAVAARLTLTNPDMDNPAGWYYDHLIALAARVRESGTPITEET